MSVRFAPSPTGSFHLGNLRTAWISYFLAKELGLAWHVRFEDIDEPRVLKGAQEEQLRDLKTLGLVPDTISVQSQKRARHWQCFTKAIQEAKLYPCYCSRKEVQEDLSSIASAPHHLTPLYTGKCRQRFLNAEKTPKDFKGRDIAWRYLSADTSGHHDFIVARSYPELDSQNLPEEKTFVASYHWACAIDDHDEKHSLLVRAYDLKQVIPFQRAIHGLVAKQDAKIHQAAAIFHCTLVTQNDGHRLEKRTPGVKLSELLSNGISASKILDIFKQSFELKIQKGAVAPGQILGETKETISLKQLGF